LCNLGVAASASSLVLAGGTLGERFDTEGCHTMIHQPDSQLQGQASSSGKKIAAGICGVEGVEFCIRNLCRSYSIAYVVAARMLVKAHTTLVMELIHDGLKSGDLEVVKSPMYCCSCHTDISIFSFFH
jgi:hypothetical protein